MGTVQHMETGDLQGRRQRPGKWRLAKVEAAAFADTPQGREQWPFGTPRCLRVAMWAVLLLCDRRVNQSGTALCILSPHSRRHALTAAFKAVALSVMVTVIGISTGILWWPLPWGMAILVLLVIGPCARSGWRNRAATRELGSVGPERPYVYVHGVARSPEPEYKGEAALVMARLADEADQRGWVLALDTGAPRLVEYYQQFGFEPLGLPVKTTWGSAVRMARRPLVGYA